MTQSFDELFWNRFDTLNKDTDLAYNFGSESYNEGYKAGAASRQAEIDKVKSNNQFSESQIGQACVKWKEIAEKRQAEIDAALKQRDSFIKAHHIAMDDVCKMKAERDALQKKYDAMYRAFTVTDDARKEWHECYVRSRESQNELQKRIDDALKVLNDASPTMLDKKAIRILKGESK